MKEKKRHSNSISTMHGRPHPQPLSEGEGSALLKPHSPLLPATQSLSFGEGYRVRRIKRQRKMKKNTPPRTMPVNARTPSPLERGSRSYRLRRPFMGCVSLPQGPPPASRQSCGETIVGARGSNAMHGVVYKKTRSIASLQPPTHGGCHFAPPFFMAGVATPCMALFIKRREASRPYTFSLPSPSPIVFLPLPHILLMHNFCYRLQAIS
jgi:hypothetical protein